MPAIWSSSERPISVRTVWVNGIRHAILTPDDPLLDVKNRQRPQTSSSDANSKTYARKYVNKERFNRLEKFDNHFIEFRVVACKKIENDSTITKIIRRQSAPPISRSLDEPRNLLDPLLLKISKNNINNSNSVEEIKHDTGYHHNVCKRVLSRESSVGKLSVLENDNKNTSSEIIRAVSFSDDCDENIKSQEIISSSNLLSDRVIQWMDMAGMVKNYKNKDNNLRLNTSDRSSVVKSKDLGIVKKHNSSLLSFKKFAANDNYKLASQQKKFDCNNHVNKAYENETESEINYLPEEDKQKSNKEKKMESDIILQTNKSMWSSYGRPQLHIFMPDISSSEEDMSSQDCLSNEDSKPEII